MHPEVLKAHKRRLHILEVQKAFHGFNCPPEILMEIEDIQYALQKKETARALKQVYTYATEGNQVGDEAKTVSQTSSQTNPRDNEKAKLQDKTLEFASKSTSQIPEEVLTTIRTQAEQNFPKDFTTQQYIINTQLEDWQSIQLYSDEDIPSTILQVIMSRSAHSFPNDFSTQLYQIKKEVEAWYNLQKLQPTDIPAEVREAVVSKATSNFPDDFSTRLYIITQELDAWRALHE